MAEADRKRFRIRAEMIRFGIIFGTIAALTFIFRPVLGMANALILAFLFRMIILRNFIRIPHFSVQCTRDSVCLLG